MWMNVYKALAFVIPMLTVPILKEVIPVNVSEVILAMVNVTVQVILSYEFTLNYIGKILKFM